VLQLGYPLLRLVIFEAQLIAALHLFVQPRLKLLRSQRSRGFRLQLHLVFQLFGFGEGVRQLSSQFPELSLPLLVEALLLPGLAELFAGGGQLLPALPEFGDQQRGSLVVQPNAGPAGVSGNHSGHHRQHRRDQKVADYNQNCPIHLPASLLLSQPSSFCRYGNSRTTRRIRLKIIPIRVDEYAISRLLCGEKVITRNADTVPNRPT